MLFIKYRHFDLTIILYRLLIAWLIHHFAGQTNGGQVMDSGCVVCIDNGHGADFQDNRGILLHKFIFINFVSNDRLRCVVVVQLYVAY